MNNPFKIITMGYLPQVESFDKFHLNCHRHNISDQSLKRPHKNFPDKNLEKIRTFSFHHLFSSKSQNKSFFENISTQKTTFSRRDLSISGNTSREKNKKQIFKTKNEENIQSDYDFLFSKLEKENNFLKSLEIKYYRLLEKYKQLKEVNLRNEKKIEFLENSKLKNDDINLENFREKIIKINSEKLKLLETNEDQKIEIRTLLKKIEIMNNLIEKIENENSVLVLSLKKENMLSKEEIIRKLEIKEKIIKDLRENFLLLKTKKCDNCDDLNKRLEDKERNLLILENKLNIEYYAKENREPNFFVEKKKLIQNKIDSEKIGYNSILQSLVESKSSIKIKNYRTINSPIKRKVKYNDTVVPYNPKIPSRSRTLSCQHEFISQQNQTTTTHLCSNKKQNTIEIDKNTSGKVFSQKPKRINLRSYSREGNIEEDHRSFLIQKKDYFGKPISVKMGVSVDEEHNSKNYHCNYKTNCDYFLQKQCICRNFPDKSKDIRKYHDEQKLFKDKFQFSHVYNSQKKIFIR